MTALLQNALLLEGLGSLRLTTAAHKEQPTCQLKQATAHIQQALHQPQLLIIHVAMVQYPHPATAVLQELPIAATVVAASGSQLSVQAQQPPLQQLVRLVHLILK